MTRERSRRMAEGRETTGRKTTARKTTGRQAEGLKAKALLMLAVQGVALLSAREALGGISFDSGLSTVKYSHDADKSDSDPSAKTYTLTSVPNESSLTPGVFQFNKPITSGSSRSDAVGALGRIADSTAASFELLAGTGVAQDDTSNAWGGASSFKLTIDLYYNVTSGGWGSTASAQAALVLAGEIGSGGYVEFIPNLRWYKGTGTGTPISSAWTTKVTKNNSGGSTTSFTQPVSFNAPFTQPTFSNGDVIHLNGTIEFRASNLGAPSRLLPVFFEAGGGAPLRTYLPQPNGPGNYSDPSSWMDGVVPGLGQSTGERAKLVNANFDPFGTRNVTPARKTITLDQNVTLIGMDLDGTNGFDIVPFQGPAGGPPTRIRFRGTTGEVVANPVLRVKNVVGNAAHTISAGLELEHTLDLVTDSIPTGGTAALPAVQLSGVISGAGGLRKMGAGVARLTNANTFGGNVEVHEGFLAAEAAGALSSVPVTVFGGSLNYNAGGAAGGLVTVKSGGQLSLGGRFAPGGNDSFALEAGAVLEASTTHVNALQASGGLSLPATGGVVLAPTDPTGQFSFNTRSFLYGVRPGQNVSVTVGTGGAATYKGFGGVQGNVATSGNVVITGAAEAFVPGGATLTVSGPVTALTSGSPTPPPPTLLKRGLGTLVFSNGTTQQWSGPTTVQEGALLVTGRHNGIVTVMSGATLGGTGLVGPSSVQLTTIKTGGVLSPGTSVGTLTVSRLGLEPGSTLRYELRSTGPGDLLVVTTPNGLVLPTVGTPVMVDVNDGLFDPALGPTETQKLFPLIDYAGAALSGVNSRIVAGPSPTDEYVFSLFDDTANTQLMLRVTKADGPQWNVPGGGKWGTAGNWIGGVPDGYGDEANFLGKATGGATVEMQGSRTLGVVTFDNDAGAGNAYVIAQTSASDVLVLDNGLSPAKVEVRKGTHLVDAPVVMLSNTVLEVAEGGRLRMGRALDVPGGKTVTKTGAGLAVLQSPLGLGAGAGVVVSGGTLDTRDINGGSVNVQLGTLRATRLVDSSLSVAAGQQARIVPDGTPAGTSVLNALSIAEDAKLQPLGQLDVNDNNLIVRGTSANAETVLAKVRDQVRSGFAGGAWDGNGIASGAAKRDPLKIHGLGVVRNVKRGAEATRIPEPMFTTFDGHDVTANDTLVVYTYYGDTDLDEAVTADDYHRIDAAFLKRLGGWENGDVNYSGRVDLDDYLLIDAAFLGQGTAAAAPAIAEEGFEGGAVAVPEPGVMGMLGVGVVGLLGRRKRKG